MTSLMEDTDETSHLGILDGREAINIHQVEGTQSMRMFIRPGSRMPLHGTGVGKALLAWLEPEQVLELLGPGPLPSFTAKTTTDTSRFLAEMAAIRERGYAVDDEERDLGVRCIAAPVQDERGDVVAAVAIAGPAVRMPLERLGELSERVMTAGRLISANLR
jgi:IclR family acetate operon transcriptional repressor